MKPTYLRLEIRFAVRFEKPGAQAHIESYDTEQEADAMVARDSSATEKFFGLYARIPDSDFGRHGRLSHIGDWSDITGAIEMMDVLTGSTEDSRSAVGNPLIYKPASDFSGMPVAVWQLANDAETYGDDAGKFILTTADGEDELLEGKVFDTDGEARDAAILHGWNVDEFEISSGGKR